MTDFSTEGCHYGEVSIDNGTLTFGSKVSKKSIFEMKLDSVEQCVVPQNNRGDLEIQFAESKDKARDSLVKMVFHFPSKKRERKEKEVEDEDEEEESEEEEETFAESLRQKVMDNGIISSAAGEVLVEFTKDQGNFISPRGKYALKFTTTTMQMLGTPYTFNIPYENLDSSFMLQKGLSNRHAFVICLKSPIRVGNQKYQNLVLETNDDRETTIEFNIPQEELSEKYSGLEQTMTNTLSNLFGKIFKGITGTKVLIPQKFEAARGGFSIRCTVKANDGLLYPMAKSFIFIHKPTLIIKFDDITSVEFERYTPQANSATKNFDLKVSLKESAIKAGEARDYVFSSIDRSEYKGLVAYMESKNLNVIKPQEEKRANVDFGEEDDDDEYEESDGDYQSPASDDDDDDENSGNESGSDSDNDNDSGSGFDEDNRPAAKKVKKASVSSKKRPRDEEDDGKKKRQKKEKKEKDLNAPKGATTSFMLFSNDVRASVKAENPGLSVTELSKIIGAKWREMSAEDKEPYEEKARKDKQRFGGVLY
jgi:structure-specific recognition protein 1